MKTASILLAVLTLLVMPHAAIGQGEEYTEDVPRGGGNQPSGPNGDADPNNGTLPQGTEEALSSEGEDGSEAADLAQSSSPSGGNSDGPGSGSDADAGSTIASPGGSGSGVDNVVGELAGGSEEGLGVLLPIIVGSALVACVAFVLFRRRGGPAGST